MLNDISKKVFEITELFEAFEIYNAFSTDSIMDPRSHNLCKIFENACDVMMLRSSFFNPEFDNMDRVEL